LNDGGADRALVRDAAPGLAMSPNDRLPRTLRSLASRCISIRLTDTVFMDFLDAKARSALMSRIRGRDTGPELAVRRYLHGKGLRYVPNDPTLPGKPDLAFKSRKVVVFVHGCFWHGHAGCAKARLPKTRSGFWQAKIVSNRARDRRIEAQLRKLGWRVLVVWQCRIGMSRLEQLYKAIVANDQKSSSLSHGVRQHPSTSCPKTSQKFRSTFR
jgi:DNA mismatch endonuclease (patch repair protein)